MSVDKITDDQQNNSSQEHTERQLEGGEARKSVGQYALLIPHNYWQQSTSSWGTTNKTDNSTSTDQKN